MSACRLRRDFLERHPAGTRLAADLGDDAEIRQAFRFQITRPGGRDLGGEFVDHADIVGRLEFLSADERLHADLVERVFDFGETIGRVDIDLDHADAGGSELDKGPLRAVGGPDSDAIADLEAEREQARCDAINLEGELFVGPADALMGGNEGFLLGPLPCRAEESFADRVFEQRRFGGAANDAELRHFLSLPTDKLAMRPGSRQRMWRRLRARGACEAQKNLTILRVLGERAYKEIRISGFAHCARSPLRLAAKMRRSTSPAFGGGGRSPQSCPPPT